MPGSRKGRMIHGSPIVDPRPFGRARRQALHLSPVRNSSTCDASRSALTWRGPFSVNAHSFSLRLMARDVRSIHSLQPQPQVAVAAVDLVPGKGGKPAEGDSRFQRPLQHQDAPVPAWSGIPPPQAPRPLAAAPGPPSIPGAGTVPGPIVSCLCLRHRPGTRRSESFRSAPAVPLY